MCSQIEGRLDEPGQTQVKPKLWFARRELRHAKQSEPRVLHENKGISQRMTGHVLGFIHSKCGWAVRNTFSSTLGLSPYICRAPGQRLRAFEGKTLESRKYIYTGLPYPCTSLYRESRQYQYPGTHYTAFEARSGHISIYTCILSTVRIICTPRSQETWGGT
jgi:hypothetical protein